MAQERRSLRLVVRDLSCQAEADAVVLGFRLGRGGFATAVLRELVEDSPATELAADQLPDSST
jgi:tRNA(Glu) U13 pseudouridine synthase TruD